MIELGLTPVRPNVLAARLIPAPHAQLAAALGSGTAGGFSYGLLSCDLDPALFTALDEATKASPVRVLRAGPVYTGLTRTADPLTGEAIGILEGADDEIVREGLKAAVRTMETVRFYATPGARPIHFFPHVVSSAGEFLSREAGVAAGDPLAYLVAPPLEAMVALDAALKAARVRLVKFFDPPTRTNRGGGFLTGDLWECQAAAHAFATALVRIAETPAEPLDRTSFPRRPKT